MGGTGRPNAGNHEPYRRLAMALATRCPHCQTAFRVASDQLKLRAGLVRCGTCKEIFNGIENLLHPDEDIAAAVNATAGAGRWPVSDTPKTLKTPVTPVIPVAPVAAVSPAPPAAPGNYRSRDQKGDNTLFRELIDEVDHSQPPAASPIDLSSPAQPSTSQPAPRAAAPSKSGYAAAYAPVKLMPFPRDPNSGMPVSGAIQADRAADADSIAHGLTHQESDLQIAAGREAQADAADSTSALSLKPVSASAFDADARAADHPSTGAPAATAPLDGQDSASLWLAATDDFDEDATYFPASHALPDAKSVDGRSDEDDADGQLEPVPAQASMSPMPGLLRPSRIDDAHAAPVPDEVEHDIFKVPPGLAAAPGRTSAAAAQVAPADSAAAEDLPDFVAEDLRRQGMQRIERPLLYAAAVVLLLLLLAQVAYALRTSIAAKFPQTRPMLDDACRIIGCSVGLPMQIDSVSIESSDFQPLADKRDQFILTVLLRNRSPTVQGWPSIELTLNDTGDKVVARRVIGPRDYLPPGTPLAKGFAAGSEQPIRMVFELTRLTASGYRVYLFYP